MEGERNHVADEVRENFTLKTLQERVWRLEAENKDLKVNNSILQTQYTSQCETQSDILRTLHANLDENYSKIEESENKNQKLEQQLEDQKQEFKDRLEEEKAMWEHRVAELQMKNEHLENELNKVSEFRQNKEAMEEKLASLTRQLQEQHDAHERDVSAFDRKKAIEIDQIRKDMMRSIKETSEMLKAKTKDQLEGTTKRTMLENEQMSTELHFQSQETARLLDRNQQLLEENAQLRRNLTIHKDLENELARRTHVYQKLIKRMHQRQNDGGESGEREDNPQAAASSSSRDLGALGAPQASAASTEECERLKRQVEGLTSTLQMIRHEFGQYRHDHATLTQLQDQSTRLIISALYELKNQRVCDPFPPPTYDENATWQFTNMTAKQKEYFFRVLLEKLNVSMCSSCFPTGGHQHSVPQASTTSLPQIGEASKQSDQANFSSFLWSVATQGGGATSPGAEVDEDRSVVTRGVQTETGASDPCFREGLWNPTTRSVPGSGAVSAAQVCGGVRSWGPHAKSRAKRGAPRLV